MPLRYLPSLLILLTSTLVAQPDQPRALVEWQEQVRLFESTEPTLKKADKKLYDALTPLLGTSPLEAIKLIEASDEQSRSPVFDFLLGNLYLGEGRLDAAQGALERTLKKHPDFRRAHRSLASVQASKGDLEGAAKHVIKVISLGGADARLYGLLGYAHFEKGNPASALSAYRLARTFDSDAMEYRRGELFCLAQTGANAEVLANIDEILKVKPKDKSLWLMRANALMGEERFSEAISTLEVMVHHGLASHAETMLLGRLLFNEEVLESAMEHFLKALDQGASPELLLPVVKALIRQDQPELAERLMAAMARQDKSGRLHGREEWRLARAELSIHSGDVKSGMKELKSLLELFPMNGSALLMLGREWVKLDDHVQGRFYLERAANIEEVQVAAWNDLGRLAWADGNARDALNWLEKVDQVRPSRQMKQVIEQLRARL